MLININFIEKYKIPLVLALTSAIFYWTFAYNLVRTDYGKLVTLYAALFFLFYKLVNIFKQNHKTLGVIAFLFRAIFIVSIPNLSQDFHRFIWDGRMILEGYSPYLFTVKSFFNGGALPIAQAEFLYLGMGDLNASHFSNYPPLNQLCFFIAALFAKKSILGSVVVLRLLIIAADFGTLHYGQKLLGKLKLPKHQVYWYIFNPFIIIEFTGNLHFEGVMIFFLIWSLYLLYINKWVLAAVVLACSISVKLIPLMFLPLFFWWFFKRNVIANAMKQSNTNKEITSSLPPRNDNGDDIVEQLKIDDKNNVIANTVNQSQSDKQITSSHTALKDNNDEMLNQVQHDNKLSSVVKLIAFYSITVGVSLLLFVPFYTPELITNYTKTTSLWFNNFEFNASLYYLARAIGYSITGYNEIAIIGKITSALVITFILCLALFRKNNTMPKLITALLFSLSFYYFTATTVHPWYLGMLLMLSVFTRYKFPLVWSGVIILSYLAYLNTNTMAKHENYAIIALEYVIVYGVFIWEIFIKKAPKMEA